MPKNTFWNIKEEKKNKIKDAAILELAEYGIAHASVNRIVKTAGIATGSFYQYFEDLNDLIIYVLIEMANEKFKYIKAEYENIKEDNFEELIKAIYKGGMRFALENEKACKISNSLMQLKGTQLFTKIMKLMPQNQVEWLIPLIEKASKNGEIRENVTTQLFMMLLTSINSTIIDYITLSSQNNNFEYTEENIEKMSDLAVSLLLKGVQ